MLRLEQLTKVYKTGGKALTDINLPVEAGQIVFDGTPAELSDDVLTRIYGEEDWAALRGKPGQDDEASAPPALDVHRLERAQ